MVCTHLWFTCVYTGQTALHIAAACSRADVTRLLLSNRADPNSQDCNGRSPLHIAVTSEAEGVFQLLLRHKNTNPDLDAEDGTTPLILATQHHSVSMVEQLLKEAHVDANTQDKGGECPNHCECIRVPSSLSFLCVYCGSRLPR